MDGLIIALLVGVLGSQAAVWYKLGRVEQRVKDHLNHHNRKE